MEIFRFKVRFVIKHPTINAEDISVELKLQPFICWTVGTQRRTPRGLHLEGMYDLSYWCSQDYDGCDDEIVEVLTGLLDYLDSHRAFLDHLRETGGTTGIIVAIFLGQRSGGPSLDWEVLKRIGDLGLNVGLDIYGGDRRDFVSSERGMETPVERPT
jgi:hypothetical protein